MLDLILIFIGALVVITIVSALFNTMGRIAAATEATALMAASFYANLSPDARERAEQYVEKIRKEEN